MEAQISCTPIFIPALGPALGVYKLIRTERGVTGEIICNKEIICNISALKQNSAIFPHCSKRDLSRDERSCPSHDTNNIICPHPVVPASHWLYSSSLVRHSAQTVRGRVEVQPFSFYERGCKVRTYSVLLLIKVRALRSTLVYRFCNGLCGTHQQLGIYIKFLKRIRNVFSFQFST